MERWIERGVWLLPLILLFAAMGFRRGWLAGLLIDIDPAAAGAGLRMAGSLVAAGPAGGPGPCSKVSQRRRPSAFEDPRWRGMAHLPGRRLPGRRRRPSRNPRGVEAGYNRGNALARAGQLEEAAQAYRQVLEQAPQHADAKTNLELVEKLLQQQQQQDSQQDQASQDSQSGENTQQAVAIRGGFRSTGAATGSGTATGSRATASARTRRTTGSGTTIPGGCGSGSGS